VRQISSAFESCNTWIIGCSGILEGSSYNSNLPILAFVAGFSEERNNLCKDLFDECILHNLYFKSNRIFPIILPFEVPFHKHPQGWSKFAHPQSVKIGFRSWEELNQ
jgi:hypothetical protein